jgi:predicted nucleotidyltransferase
MESRAQILLGDIASVLKEEWSRFHVKRAWLFGSHAVGKTTSESDWDFLVEFSEPPGFDTFMGLKSGLEEKLNGHVDLLSRTACPSRFLELIKNDLIDVT